jgi:hypothetical protein
MSRSLFLLLALSVPAIGDTANPKCDSPDNWAAMSAYGKLKNAGLVDNALVDFKKTHVTLLASERIGKDLYRQAHRIIYTFFSGKTVEVITLNDATNEECSGSGVEIFVVGSHIAADACGG